MTRIPERLVTAVDRLDVRPADHVMEIGCGPGLAAALICDRLVEGRLLAVDRSATAIDAAAARNAEAVAAGRARFVTAALEDVDPVEFDPFDKVLAVNVNLFWARPAQRELRLIADLLRPGGRLFLCYEPPGGERIAQMQSALADNMLQAGYRSASTTRELARSTLLTVTARPL